MQIKQKHILVLGRRYQYSRHLLQNPKVPKNFMGFNNHAQRSTPPYYLNVDNPLHTRFLGVGNQHAQKQKDQGLPDWVKVFSPHLNNHSLGI